MNHRDLLAQNDIDTERLCYTCLGIGRHMHTCMDPGSTLRMIRPRPVDDALSFTGVIQAVEKPAKARTRSGRGVVGGCVAVMAGVALMAVGFMMNDPLASSFLDMVLP